MKNEQVKNNMPKLTARVAFKNHDAQPTPDGVISQLHYHDELEFLAIFSGEFVAVVDDVEYVAHPGDVVFINAGVPHKTMSKTPYNTGLIQFRENNFLDSEIAKVIKYSARLGSLSESKIRILRSEELFKTFSEIAEESINKKSAYELYVRSGIYKILGYMYRTGILTDAEELYNTKATQKIIPVLSYINQNYGEDVTLESASAMLGFDQSYFCRVFKAATGATFTEYLNFVRVCRAEKLLSRTSKSILEISEDVGFSSVSYFNRVFKKYRNCSPKHYRKALYCNM